MATTVTINARDVFQRAPKTGDAVIFRAPRLRPGTADHIITPKPVTVNLAEGRASVSLEPGPCQVIFRVGTSVDSRPFDVLIPASGSVTLRDLIERNYRWEPEIVSEVRTIQSKAEAAARKAESFRDEARTAATQAKEASDGIATLRDQAAVSAAQAGQSATNADAAAQRAQESVTTATASATRVGQSANLAAQGRYAAEKAARDAAASATQAGEAATQAAGEIARATREADRSEEAARRAVEGANRVGDADAVVAAKRAAEAAAARSGTQADRSKAEADRTVQAASTATSGISPQVRSEIDAKATKEDLARGLDGKANAAHLHRSREITDTTYNVGLNGDRDRLIRLDSQGKIAVYGSPGITARDGAIQVDATQGGRTPAASVVNKRYVDGEVAKKADVSHTHQLGEVEGLESALGAKAEAAALAGKADQQAVDTALAGKADKSHRHVSADITDAVDAESQSQTVTYKNRLVRLDGHGNLCAKLPKTSGSVATKKYVDDEVKKAAPVGHKHQVSDITGLSAEISSAVQQGASRSKMNQVVSEWATFYRVGNIVTVQVYNGTSSKAATIPEGYTPAVNSCYAPVTWLSDPASVVLLNIDSKKKQVTVERAPSAHGLVHGTAVYMTTDPWPA
ncbi:hypothetical protein V5S96_11300 [Corynebacterium mastitidis]|uniref:Uncharacterized protein n=1 Tax=Corynebacterium mastitidis TaxID=161890 RepID=A0ABU8P3H5_9CORY